MTERLLQFIWQFRYFNTRELRLESGEPIRILFPGIPNPNQGADFLDARIRMDSAVIAGNVEIHIKASDWRKHGHEKDKNFQNIILHVVWEDDAGPGALPTLVLRDRVAKWRLARYEQWRSQRSFIACEKNLDRVDPGIWQVWKDRLLESRLQRKTAVVQGCLVESRQYWDPVFWWFLARNFGLKVNAGVFEEIARSLPLSLLRHHSDTLPQLESLLLGQAGLLDKECGDDYIAGLQKEYRFLQAKYGLSTVRQPVQFLRMRPANFPALRLALLASLLSKRLNWFTLIQETESLSMLKSSLSCQASPYWDWHYSPGRLSPRSPRLLSPGLADSIVVNTVAPILFAYGHLRKDAGFRQKAIRWLLETGGENNKTTRSWTDLGIPNDRAADSQALIECKTRYCDPGNCLECGVGRELLRRR